MDKKFNNRNKQRKKFENKSFKNGIIFIYLK